MSTENKQTGRRVLTGIVSSNKMDKTVSVEVTRRVKHPKYHKYVSRTARYKAHDEDNQCGEGDTVVIQESRPYSRMKRWLVIERHPRQR